MFDNANISQTLTSRKVMAENKTYHKISVFSSNGNYPQSYFYDVDTCIHVF